MLRSQYRGSLFDTDHMGPLRFTRTSAPFGSMTVLELWKSTNQACFRFDTIRFDATDSICKISIRFLHRDFDFDFDLMFDFDVDFDSMQDLDADFDPI